MTANIELRDVHERDLSFFFAHQQDAVANAMAAFPPRDGAEFAAHWAKILKDPAVHMKTIVFEGRVAGHIATFERLGEREVGYWIGREYWGKGIASRALADFLGLEAGRPLVARVAKHNLASLRVLEKCGFRFDRDAGPVDIRGVTVEEVVLKLGETPVTSRSRTP